MLLEEALRPPGVVYPPPHHRAVLRRHRTLSSTSAPGSIPPTCTHAIQSYMHQKENQERKQGTGHFMVNKSLQEEMEKTIWGRTLAGGLAGAIAMGVNVGAFMWLRTIMSFQQVHGTRMIESIRVLYRQGGVGRFYHGIVPALVQGPVCRFGDTAANAGVLAFLNRQGETRDLPIVIKTVAASVASAFWRVALMPLDTLVICQQVEGQKGWGLLYRKLRSKGVSSLFQGASASFAANILGHYPWFAVYNLCESTLTEPQDFKARLLRNAAMGFAASFASDILSNSFTVVKVCKQASVELLTYRQTTQQILAVDGYRGLLGRGLTVRLLGNGLQGMTFGIMWKVLDDCIFRGQCPEIMHVGGDGGGGEGRE